MNPNNSQEALQQLQQAQAQSQDPNTILANQRQQLGVDAAQNTVTGLRGAINNTTKLLKQVAPSVMGRTANSLVTNAQATRQIGNEQAPIAQNLSDQGTEYNQANQDLGQLQQRAQEAAGGIYAGQQDKLSYAQNLYNTLYQKEQDAQNMQEQIRQFNAQQALASHQFDLSNPSANATNDSFSSLGDAADPSSDKNRANVAIQSLLRSGDTSLINRTLRAITESANKGNMYDKYKLELLQHYRTASPYAGILNSASKITPQSAIANIPNVLKGTTSILGPSSRAGTMRLAGGKR